MRGIPPPPYGVGRGVGVSDGGSVAVVVRVLVAFNEDVAVTSDKLTLAGAHEVTRVTNKQIKAIFFNKRGNL